MAYSRTTKTAALAVVAWMTLEAVLWFAGFGDIRAIEDTGPDASQAANIFLHWPGLMLAQSLHLPITGGLLVAEAVTLAQMFVLFWIVIALWRRVYGRHAG
jgi:hypothetical protein